MRANQYVQTALGVWVPRLGTAAGAEVAEVYVLDPADDSRLTYVGGTAVVGDIADDNPNTTAPVQIGGVAKSGLNGVTLVTAGDRKALNLSRDGTLFGREDPLEDIVDGTAENTDGTSTEVIAAWASGYQHIRRAIFSNEHATTVAFVVLKCGTTARTGKIPVPPGGAIVNLGVLKADGTNKAWNFDPTAAVTTLSCTLIGFKSLIG